MVGRIQAPQDPAAATPESGQHLAFSLGGETFAMELGPVQEVIQFEGLTEIPLMPPFIRGVLNLRGVVVPVVDLSLRLGRGPTDTSRRTCVIILSLGQGEEARFLGILVDSVNEVLEIRQEDLEPPPSLGFPSSELLAGVGKAAGKFLIVLAMDRLLSHEERAVLDAAGNPEAAPASC